MQGVADGLTHEDVVGDLDRAGHVLLARGGLGEHRGQEVGAAAMLSRALGGLLGDKVVLAMPGSPAAVRLAMEKLVLPELGHLVQQARH